MELYGTYYNQHDQLVEVYIVTHGDRDTSMDIGTEDSGIYFSDDPVEISTQVNDTFDVLLCNQATIRLLCHQHVAELYCSSCLDAAVLITCDGVNAFVGYVEPQTFSQGYNEDLDEVELTCIDALSALQYINYRGVGSDGVSYAEVKEKAGQVTFADILRMALESCFKGVRELYGWDYSAYFDQSKLLQKGGDGLGVWTGISISELLFLGDEEDDVWTYEDVLTEVLKYLNLHIEQEGGGFYIFSWETLRACPSQIPFLDIFRGGTSSSFPATYDITDERVADCDAQLSIPGTYNLLKLTAKTEEMEQVVESPLDSDSLQYAFPAMQKYMTEYSSWGSGKSARSGFYDLVNSGSTGYDGASVTEWFMWMRKTPNWVFHEPAETQDVVSKYATGKNQQALFNRMGQVAGMAALVGMGKISKGSGGSDNSPVSKVSMSDYLAISINGNGLDGENTARPSDADIKAAIPCAQYTGSKAGGVFSPADDSTVNYLVISGNIILNPLMPTTGRYHGPGDVKLNDAGDLAGTLVARPVESKNGNRYYTRLHWKAESWRDAPTWDADTDKADNPGLLPYTGEAKPGYTYNYSAVGDSTDRCSKVAVLACMLVIGSKVLVEKLPGEDLGTGVKGTGNGQFDDFVWMDYKERKDCQSDEEYYAQCFTIGFDPKIGDSLIGSEFSMQNNISYTDGIDAEGIGIPIRKDDKVHGQVRFLILGPVNTLWNDVQVTRSGNFWHHTKWGTGTVALLAHTSCILVKELEVKVYSNNANMGTDDDQKDIVYMSSDDERYANRKDDLEMKITTALTSDECQRIGVRNGVFLSSPLDVATGDALVSIYDANLGEQAKPEQLYVDAYWREWHAPRVVMDQNITDRGISFPLFCRYRNKAIGKTFFVQGVSRNLTEGTMAVSMKEVGCD